MISKPTQSKTIYTCPMHPEVQQDHPGDCPKCGMALEPKTARVGTDDEENAELRNMTRRFWIGAALTLPVFVLAMAHMVPVLGAQSWVTGDVSRWIQFVLTIPVVCWAGWPFFQRGWRSVVTLNLNMFTLIAIGVGAAFTFSTVAMLFPDLFPDTMQHNGKVNLYFEAAGMVTVLTMNESKTTTKDPICGMTVDEATAIHTERDGKTFYFCSEHCRQKFLSTLAGAQSEKKPGGCCG